MALHLSKRYKKPKQMRESKRMIKKKTLNRY